MSSSSTYTFTKTDAEYLTSKVTADLKRIQRLFGKNAPSDRLIARYEQELIALLRAGYLDKITYGFRKNDVFLPPTVTYKASSLKADSIMALLGISSERDDPPGGIKYDKDTDLTGAHFGSFLDYSEAWCDLSIEKKLEFESSLDISRGWGVFQVSGVANNDRIYSRSDNSLNRTSYTSK